MITCFLGLLPILFFNSIFAVSYDETLAGKFSMLNTLSARQGYINLNVEQFNLLLRSPPRNYSVILLLTALSSSRKCTLCKMVHEEFQILANSWHYSKQRDGRLFFAVADFDHSPQIFEILHQETVPAVIHVAAMGSIKPSDYMDMKVQGISADAISQWIGSLTSIQIRVFRPPSYTGTVLLAIFMSLGATILYFRKLDISCLYNTSLWSTISLGVIMCGITGQVYNHIRGPPFLHVVPPNGEFSFIYEGSEFQFVAETLIVMLLYIGASGGLLLMTEVGSDNKSSQQKRKIFIILGVVMFALSVSLLLSVFRRKYPSYPYSFFIK